MRKMLTIRWLAVMTAALVLSLGLMLSLTACGNQEEAGSEQQEQVADYETGLDSDGGGAEGDADSGKAELSKNNYNSLMKEIAARKGSLSYDQWMTDENFAEAKIFGIDRDGAKGKAYARLNISEYVEFKGKAYNMSGISAECIINFSYLDKGVKLEAVDWSADGGAHLSWLNENFPENYLMKCLGYEVSDDEGINNLEKTLQARVEKQLGVPCENDDLLIIDTENQTYEIVKINESGSGESYKFETETREKGAL